MEKTLKDIIKEYYQEAGVTSSQLAEKLGMSRQMMYYHLDKRNVEVIIRIEQILGIPIGYISDKVMYYNLEQKKKKLNEKKKKEQKVLNKIVASIEIIEKEQVRIMNKKQMKIFN